MEKDYQDISKKDFKQHNKSAGYYHYPSLLIQKNLLNLINWLMLLPQFLIQIQKIVLSMIPTQVHFNR